MKLIISRALACIYYCIAIHTPTTVQEMYAFCHEALADYVDSFETYANFKELV